MMSWGRLGGGFEGSTGGVASLAGLATGVGCTGAGAASGTGSATGSGSAGGVAGTEAAGIMGWAAGLGGGPG